ncbi:MAG TPA: saccharopine dehydrogenase NADP-binding domain-containing protein [Bacillota bacterium]|nr:saccharopine dehydrogenase NADP-binding domain-containing protein [Bacillota bacterium]
MRIAVLGGAGDIGRAAVRFMLAMPGVHRVTVADIRIDKAAEVVRDQGDGRAVAAPIDIADRPRLIELMREHDVTLGAAGPFYRFEEGVVRAAVEAGAAYVSVCDDHDATETVLALDGPARERKARILVGAGWTPGLSNSLAKRAAESMDRVDAIRIAWAGASADAPGHAVLLHTLHIFAGTVPSFRGGRLVRVAAGGEPELVRFPPPVGTVRVFTVGHPEPITVPVHIGRGIQECHLKGGLKEPVLTTLAVAISRLGLIATPARQRRVAALIKPALPLLERLGPRSTPCSAIRVDVSGTRAGTPARESWGAADRMAILTALPAALITHRLGQGIITRLGVYPPEADGAVDPRWLCQAASERGLAIINMGGEQAHGDHHR